MLVNFEGTLRDIPASDMAVLHYPNDLLNGLYVDIDDNYLFFSVYVPEHLQIIERVIHEEEVEVFDLSNQDIIYGDPPHRWCMAGLARILGREAERLCEEADEQ